LVARLQIRSFHALFFHWRNLIEAALAFVVERSDHAKVADVAELLEATGDRSDITAAQPCLRQHGLDQHLARRRYSRMYSEPRQLCLQLLRRAAVPVVPQLEQRDDTARACTGSDYALRKLVIFDIDGVLCVADLARKEERDQADERDEIAMCV
jgi:hypothetical protein